MTTTDLAGQGTDQFMSDGLLKSARLNKSYLQSPIDDLWSFYYVAQWAAVYNDTMYSDPKSIPADLSELRDFIAGDQRARALGRQTVTGPTLDPCEYGQFLVNCSPFLREWELKLNQLTSDWRRDNVASITNGDRYTSHYPYFRRYTDRGVLELVQLIQQHFPNGLSGL
jgi:hypothetical protein